MPLMQGKSKKAFEHNVKAEMNAGKPMNQSLAVAYAVKRKNKMTKGGMPSDDKNLARIIILKHMNKGGMCYAKGGPVESEDMSSEIDWGDDDFLSDSEQDHAIDLTYPDPDHVEDTEGMQKSRILEKVMAKVRARQMNKA